MAGAALKKSSIKSPAKSQRNWSPANKTHNCEHCEKSFQQKRYLLRHIKTHTGGKPYQCKTCPSKFSRKDVLVNHKRTHTGEKPFKCEHCQKSFADPSTLKRHTKIHTGEKPFECQFCDYSCIESSNILRHERTHTGEKPFKCTYCQTSFAQAAHLKSHAKIHTQEKAFMSQLCDHSAGIRTSTIPYEWTRKGEKQYGCQLCSFSTSKIGNLKQHDNIYRKNLGSQGVARTKLNVTDKSNARTKTYKCIDCSKIYSTPSNLLRHIKTLEGAERYACRFCEYSAFKKRAIGKHEREAHAKIQRKTYQAENSSAIATSSSSLVQHGHVPMVQEHDHSAADQLLLPKSSQSQCKVCEFLNDSTAGIALHMNATHKLPVVTLRRLAVF